MDATEARDWKFEAEAWRSLAVELGEALRGIVGDEPGLAWPAGHPAWLVLRRLRERQEAGR